MSVDLPKISNLLENLRQPEKQIEGMAKETGMTPPSGPAKVLIDQAKTFERSEGKLPLPELPKMGEKGQGGFPPETFPPETFPPEKFPPELPKIGEKGQGEGKFPPEKFPPELPELPEGFPELPEGRKKLVESIPSPGRSPKEKSPKRSPKKTSPSPEGGIERL